MSFGPLTLDIWHLNIFFTKRLTLEMIHFTGDIYENIKPQLLLLFSLSKKIDFSRQKLVLR